ncbi:MAG: hypothetical protein ACRD0U_18990, partial [Acidimicrobiales bacterium]
SEDRVQWWWDQVKDDVGKKGAKATKVTQALAGFDPFGVSKKLRDDYDALPEAQKKTLAKRYKAASDLASRLKIAKIDPEMAY